MSASGTARLESAASETTHYSSWALGAARGAPTVAAAHRLPISGRETPKTAARESVAWGLADSVAGPLLCAALHLRPWRGQAAVAGAGAGGRACMRVRAPARFRSRPRSAPHALAFLEPFASAAPPADARFAAAGLSALSFAWGMSSEALAGEAARPCGAAR
jgi:hypothetical protein